MPGQLALPWAAPREERPVPTGLNPEAAFARVFRRLGLGPAAPEFRVEYRPFAGLRSTIRVRGGEAHVRLSDFARPLRRRAPYHHHQPLARFAFDAALSG